jgi:hypothetical protein
MRPSEPVQRDWRILQALKETPMLARRFTIVCLLMTLFGISFSILVAEASRPARSKGIAMAPCIIEEGPTCKPPTRR